MTFSQKATKAHLVNVDEVFSKAISVCPPCKRAMLSNSAHSCSRGDKCECEVCNPIDEYEPPHKADPKFAHWNVGDNSYTAEYDRAEKAKGKHPHGKKRGKEVVPKQEPIPLRIIPGGRN